MTVAPDSGGTEFGARSFRKRLPLDQRRQFRQRHPPTDLVIGGCHTWMRPPSRAVSHRSSRSLYSSLTVDHPGDAEAVYYHPKALRPECFFDWVHDATTVGEQLEKPFSFTRTSDME